MAMLKEFLIVGSPISYIPKCSCGVKARYTIFLPELGAINLCAPCKDKLPPSKLTCLNCRKKIINYLPVVISQPSIEMLLLFPSCSDDCYKHVCDSVLNMKELNLKKQDET